jgi:hypothetical protein
MTHEEALELAREVINGKSRGYVSAAIALSHYLLGREGAGSTALPPARASIPPTPPRAFLEIPHDPVPSSWPPPPEEVSSGRLPTPPAPRTSPIPESSDSECPLAKVLEAQGDVEVGARDRVKV